MSGKSDNNSSIMNSSLRKVFNHLLLAHQSDASRCLGVKLKTVLKNADAGIVVGGGFVVSVENPFSIISLIHPTWLKTLAYNPGAPVSPH